MDIAVWTFRGRGAECEDEIEEEPVEVDGDKGGDMYDEDRLDENLLCPVRMREEDSFAEGTGSLPEPPISISESPAELGADH